MYRSMHIRYRCACHILVVLEFLARCSKNTQIQRFMKIHPVEAESFHADEEMDKLTQRS